MIEHCWTLRGCGEAASKRSRAEAANTSELIAIRRCSCLWLVHVRMRVHYQIKIPVRVRGFEDCRRARTATPQTCEKMTVQTCPSEHAHMSGVRTASLGRSLPSSISRPRDICSVVFGSAPVFRALVTPAMSPRITDCMSRTSAT